MIAVLTMLAIGLTSAWSTRRTAHAAWKLLAAAAAMLGIAVAVAMQVCRCGDPLAALHVRDLRLGLLMAGGFAFAAMLHAARAASIRIRDGA